MVLPDCGCAGPTQWSIRWAVVMVKNDARVPAELECAFGSRLGKRNTRQYTLIAARAGKGVQIGTVLAPCLTLLVRAHFYRAVSCEAAVRMLGSALQELPIHRALGPWLVTLAHGAAASDSPMPAHRRHTFEATLHSDTPCKTVGPSRPQSRRRFSQPSVHCHTGFVAKHTKPRRPNIPRR